MADIPVKSIADIEVKSEVSDNDKILILDSVSEEARLASKEELKGDKWDTWEKWDKGDKWDTGASIVEAEFVWNDMVFTKDDENTVVLQNAKTELKWDKWEKGDKWDKGEKWDQWPAWPWSWDVLWPSSATDWNIALFDWTTGKLLKDWNKKISDFATSTQWWKADTALQPNDAISKLNNDSWFQTQQQVNSAISTAIAGKQDNLSNMSTAEWQWGIAETQRTMTAKNLKEIIQYYTSTFITNSVSDLTNYYLKSETYTKSEVASLIWSIQQFHYEIFANISDVTTPASNVLYLIWPKGSGSDLYEEYVYTTQFIKIWETSIDLSQYVTITALNTALASYVTSSALTTILNDYVTSTDLSTTLQDYVTSSSLATTLNDYATTNAMNQALANKITNPSWWTEWQVLTKTQNWESWSTPQTITVDDTMSDSSPNPVQNQVVKWYIDDMVWDIETLLANI